jgi:predicted O-methyltransferase YrrM
MTIAEAEALGGIVELLPPNAIVVQVGAYWGASTVAILAARPDLFIFSIDLKPYPQEQDNIKAAGLSGNGVVRVLGDSAHVGARWPYAVDMVYIDGDHRYEAVKVDILTWIPKVKTGGIIAFHDYILNPKPSIKGNVAKAVKELVHKPVIAQVERFISFEV